MKALMRGFCWILSGAIMAGSGGCGSDNETDAVKAANTGKPAPAAEGAAPTSTPKYSSIEDYAKSRKDPYSSTKLDPAKKK
ncbi:MAG: hypothetical protein ACLQGP_23805 [Isosphaeraceae bacterium]